MKNITDCLVEQFVSTGLDYIGLKYIYLDGKKTRYIADTDGNIYSTNFNHTKKLKKLKTRVYKGYNYIMLPYKGTRKNFRLNRLMALTFLVIPEHYKLKGLTVDDLEVNHIDGNPLNDRISNLEWVTPDENKSHAVKNKLLAYGENNKSSKLSESQVKEICEKLQEGSTSRYKLANIYDVDYSTIDSIFKGKTWKDITSCYDFSNYNVPKSGVTLGEKNNLSKITEYDARKICELFVENKLSQKQIAEKMNVSIGTVARIQYGKSWKHISKEYDFSHYNVDGRNKK